MSGSGIVATCEMCGTTRELTLDEVTSAPTPTKAAEKVLKYEGWEGSVCDKCVAVEKEIDEEVNGSGDTPVDPDDHVVEELPQRTLGMSMGDVRDIPDADPNKAKLAPNQLVYEGYDVRVIANEYTAMDDKGEHIVQALFVERAKTDGMGEKAWLRVSPGQGTWVIQSLARLIFELVNGGAKAPERVHLGQNKYIPTSVLQ